MSLIEAMPNKKQVAVSATRVLLRLSFKTLDHLEKGREWPSPERVAKDLARKVDVVPGLGYTAMPDNLVALPIDRAVEAEPIQPEEIAA